MENKRLHLKKNPTLRNIQEYVAKMEKARGFSKESAIQKCLLLGEEIGELFKSVRKAEKVHTDVKAKITSVADELADILIYISALANKFKIDLETAFRNKEEGNKKREWKWLKHEKTSLGSDYRWR